MGCVKCSEPLMIEIKQYQIKCSQTQKKDGGGKKAAITMTSESEEANLNLTRFQDNIDFTPQTQRLYATKTAEQLDFVALSFIFTCVVRAYYDRGCLRWLFLVNHHNDRAANRIAGIRWPFETPHHFRRHYTVNYTKNHITVVRCHFLFIVCMRFSIRLFI